MKKRITALLLCCVMLLTLCPGLISTATAYDDTQPDQAEATGETVQPTVNFTDVAPFLPPVSGGVRILRAPLAAANYAANDAANFAATDNGMKISKTATRNDDGTYTITLEAYATGSKVITEQKTDIPTDIILVLDQSGSMADDIGQVQYTAYTGNNTQNKNNYERRHNGGSANLWHKLPDGSYVSVSVTLQQTITYNKITKGRNDNGSSGYTNYWENRNNLYTYVNGEIKKVVYTRERDWFWENWNCKYALEDGTILNQNNEGSHYSPTFQNTDDGYLYLRVLNENQNVYTYTYTDSAGVVQTIGTSTGASTRYTPAFYQRSTTTSGGGSRLNALKSAANVFANAVAAKAAGADGDITTTADNIDHRIAVVGYADTDWDYGYNTGVFIGSTLNRYENNAAGVYSTALQDMSTTNGKSNVAASLDALQASGATRTDYGLTMANGILNANPVPTGETRNRVVIVFTDGSPTNSNGFQRSVANSAISTANAIKAGGTTVYSIGIFSGADASTAGKEPDEDYYEDSWGWTNYTDAEMSAACNWFMQKVSSNNGTPRTPSYYLSAGDSASLNNIFQQISNQIETGGAETTLSSETVVKDIISPYFTLPAGTTASGIQIDTYGCTGKTGNTYTWSGISGGNGGASATVNGDQVSVTGFDFSENWCGSETNADGSTTYHGNKLVITFKVEPRPGFLGGNDVITNTSAGVYENSSAENPVMTFDQPQVDVTIKKPDITLPDANVYLGAYFSETVNAEDLKNGTKVKFGDDIELDLTKPNENWGLESWQTEYVTIEVKVTDKDGNEVTNFEKLTEDTEYKVSVSIKPKTPKTGNSGYDESMAGTIHVFKPELTFKDSTAYYGESVPANNDYSSNYVANSEKWKNGGKYSTDDGVQMIGTKPTLDITYTPDGSKLEGGKYTKQDLPVKATVNIGTDDVTSYTTFLHETCTVDGCKWNNEITSGNPAFLIHIKTCTLTITKRGCNITMDENQSFIFDVTGGAIAQNMKVTVQGNGTATIVGLPVGTYTVTEDGNWSWRYKADGPGEVTLDAANHTGTVIITNERTDPDYWLSGDSYAVNYVGCSKAQGTFLGA